MSPQSGSHSARAYEGKPRGRSRQGDDLQVERIEPLDDLHTGFSSMPVTNDDGDVEEGYQAGRDAGANHIRSLHWGLDPFGTLNDIWYCVKCIGMVNSAGGGAFSKSPRVVDGYTEVFHDVFGGPMSQFAEAGLDQSLSGWHTRSAVAGYDLPGNCKIEPEMIVQIDPELAVRVIRERGPHV